MNPFRSSVIECWTLFGIAACIILLRTYARLKVVGWRKLQLDDFLIFLVLVTASTLGRMLLTISADTLHLLSGLSPGDRG
jgi:hypothetical protein